MCVLLSGERRKQQTNKTCPFREYSRVPFELRMFSRAAALLSTAHVRVNDELTNTRRTLAVRDVGQDVMEVLDLLASRLVLHHTPV